MNVHLVTITVVYENIGNKKKNKFLLTFYQKLFFTNTVLETQGSPFFPLTW